MQLFYRNDLVSHELASINQVLYDPMRCNMIIFSEKHWGKAEEANLFSIQCHGYWRGYSLATFWGEISTCFDSLGLACSSPSEWSEYHAKCVLCSFYMMQVNWAADTLLKASGEHCGWTLIRYDMNLSVDVILHNTCLKHGFYPSNTPQPHCHLPLMQASSHCVMGHIHVSFRLWQATCNGTEL